ncbi:hypothetical protein Ddc_18382 [Ditylenchus destructor]|nr:hypothetical protein Ddc_18382 [Ditylenchus destructor]
MVLGGTAVNKLEDVINQENNDIQALVLESFPLTVELQSQQFMVTANDFSVEFIFNQVNRISSYTAVVCSERNDGSIVRIPNDPSSLYTLFILAMKANGKLKLQFC